MPKKLFDDEFRQAQDELDMELMTQMVAATRSYSNEEQLRQLHRKFQYTVATLKDRLEQASL